MIEALKCITDQEVAAIYHNHYWCPLKFWELLSPLAIFHFGASVNHGVFGATRMIQQAVGANVDGEIRPQTKRKISELAV
jgi:lysozyme family protein